MSSSWSDAFGLDPHGFGVDEGPGSGADAVAPIITDRVPVGAIGRRTPVAFTVTDETELRRIVLVAYFSTGWETVYNGSAFSPTYAESSVQVLIPGRSYRFTVLRRAGWPEAPQIEPFAFDGGGNEPTLG